MSELSLKALAFLQNLSTSQTVFTITDLDPLIFSYYEKAKVLEELENCGCIEVNHRFITEPFVLTSM